MFQFLSIGLGGDYVNNIIQQGAAERITDERFIELEIQRFKASKRRKEMIDGERYYEGNHDILKRKRTIIGEDGKLEVVENLPNNRIVNNQYGKMVDQKKNYLLGQPIAFNTENDIYTKLLKKIFNKKFQRLIKNIGEDSLNSGIGWLHPYYNEHGEFTFKRFKPYEVIPGWADADHTYLDYAIRIYEVIAYEGQEEKTVEKVEVYDENGIYRFVLEGSKLVPDEVPFSNYFTTVTEDGDQVIEQGWNWLKIPLIPFKYNSKEIPLIRKVKTLQDGLNTILSNFQNNMEEDARNTILILVNYDGQNLGEFRKNLATYGAVKVKTVDGAGGDLKTLQVEVNADNYKAIIEIFKKAIIENAKGYDAKDDRLSGNPNQMNIQSMYSDIELDANEMETEYQASFEDLLWFVNVHLFNVGFGDFDNEEVEIIFNRDIMISESEVITNVTNSVGILSDESLIAQHPWVDDPQLELKRKAEEKQKEMDEYMSAFNPAIRQPLNGDNSKDGVVDEE
jgi:SPP1 family phage portal protein